MSGGGGYMRGGRKDVNGWERNINKGYKLTTKRSEYEWNKRGESGGGGDVVVGEDEEMSGGGRDMRGRLIWRGW